MAKKFFWLKLKEDFFRDKWIKKLRRVAGGDTYTIIYLKMQLLSLKNEGLLFREDLNVEFHEELALEIDEDEQNVLFTLMYLQNNGLLEEVNEGEFMLPDTIKAIGSESDSAERVRRHRQSKEQQKALQCNEQVTISNTEKEKEKEKEKDIIEIFETEVSNDLDIKKSSSKKIEKESLLDIQFEEWWNIYDKKMAKPNALKAFRKAVKKFGYEKIKEDTKVYVKNFTSDKKFKPYPATFLNGYSEEDERFNNNLSLDNTTNKNQIGNQYKPVDQNDLFRDC